jgi:DNA-binding NtrC family response regulator
VAELDGKRGLLTSALHHTQLAQRLLAVSPHLGLEAWTYNNLLAIETIRCNVDRASEYGAVALATSFECGAVSSIRRSLGNMGRLQLIKGDFEAALDFLTRALSYSSSNNEQVNGLLESIARVHLAQGDLSESLSLAIQVDRATQQPNGTGRYVHRHSLLTKAEVLARLGKRAESLACVEDVLILANRAGDRTLFTVAELLKAELLLAAGRNGEVWKAISDAMSSISGESAELFALYERAIACTLAASGFVSVGLRHASRARRIYRSLRNAPATIELERSVAYAQSLQSEAMDSVSKEDGRLTADLLQNIAALMLHAGRPELLATELIAILSEIESVTGAVAVARGEDGTEETLASCGAAPAGDAVRVESLGVASQRTIEVRFVPCPDIESQAALNSITLLLGTVRDLERARSEREARLTLWPIEELPSEDDDSVVLGQMQKVMTFARKVAQTNISVLLTGESGTGKEVLARAIHRFSTRAKKPFVPFNCTAIPRELLESQLFGFRRGAFTGAERDNPGLIRAAKDGTLFFDEIGELGLDLQPKLLRFLESGEINPLGETTPFLVNVRVIAATNADLEQLVSQGRFREDLFYRLNVVRLTIPPLRERRDEIPALVHHFVGRAAAEFRKGRIRVAEETMEHLLLYKWPGNVRQLQNELRRMVALADADSVLVPATLTKAIRQETERALRAQDRPESTPAPLDKLGPTLSRIEREMIKAALHANSGRLEATAKALGISRKGLYLKRQRLGV